MPYPPKLQNLLDLLAMLPDRAERIQMLIDIADRFRPVPEEVATRPYDPRHQAPHCESEAYVWGVPRDDGRLDFHFAVENPQGISARAMAVILGEALSGAPPEEAAGLSSDLPFEIFGRELSMGKSMGLAGMVAMVQHEARRHLEGARSRAEA